MSSVELHREGAVAFAVPLPRALFRDARLTFGARGLFAFLWDLPEGWVLRLSHLVKMGPEGRDALRARLRELEKVGAVRIEAIRADGGRVAGKRWVLIAADRWAIEASLAQEPLQDDGSTEKRVFRSSVEPIIDKPDAKVLQGVKVMQGEAAAPRTRGNNSATAPNDHKRRVKRASGIVTWTSADLPGAERVEQQYNSDEILAAVDALLAKDKEPVPGLVERKIQRQLRERRLEEQRATSQVQRAEPAFVGDPAAMAKGEQFVADIRRKSKNQNDKPLVAA